MKRFVNQKHQARIKTTWNTNTVTQDCLVQSHFKHKKKLPICRWHWQWGRGASGCLYPFSPPPTMPLSRSPVHISYKTFKQSITSGLSTWVRQTSGDLLSASLPSYISPRNYIKFKLEKVWHKMKKSVMAVTVIINVQNWFYTFNIEVW